MASWEELNQLMYSVFDRFVQENTPEAAELNETLVIGTNEVHPEYTILVYPTDEEDLPWGMLGYCRDDI